jgi:uncharacterized membrane protein
MSNSVIKSFKETVYTVLLTVSLFSLALALIERAFKKHWLLGAILTIFYGIVIIFLGLKDIRSKEAKEYSIHKGIRIYILLILAGAAIFSSISMFLMSLGWAKYSSDVSLTFTNFNVFYIWIFFDLIPGLKVSETLGVRLSLTPVGSVAGLPVVLFRVFVIFGVIASFKSWWKVRFSKD